MAAPEFDQTAALFLDLDGTLLDIAATPDSVVVARSLPELLRHLHALLGGALAIVSGRPLRIVDRLLSPFLSAAAGEHGVTLRFADGTVEEMPAGVAVSQAWRDSLVAATERWPGVLVETKPHGCAVHYRLAPERRDEVWKAARSLVPDDHPWFRLIPAHEAVEIGPRATSKGHAVERFMTSGPFKGRRPIYVGDDFTDEAGMSTARRYGGEGLRVQEVFGGNPALVRAWLARNAKRLGGRRSSSKRRVAGASA
jgi:trehalose 6-phosphate phosphatase